MEVEATVSNVIGLKDATSYGVEIPGNDGNNDFKHNKFIFIMNRSLIYI